MSYHGTPALIYEDMQHRVLFACVGVSIALHVAVLLVFPGLRPSVSAGSSQPLTAIFASTLVLPKAQVAAPKLLSRSRREVNLDAPQPILATSEPGADAAQPAEHLPGCWRSPDPNAPAVSLAW